MAEPWSDGDVLTAAHLAAMPWGVMGYANGSTSDQSGITSATDITSLSVTFTAVSTRLYRTTLVVNAQQLTNASTPNFIIANGSNTVVKQASVTAAASDGLEVVVVSLETGLSGSTTRKGRVSTASGTITVLGTSSRFASIIVEDVGAA